MKHCKTPEINTLVAQLVRDGWHFRRTGKHVKLRTPQGTCTLTVPLSPSDRHAWLNFRRDVHHAQRSVTLQ